MTGETFYDSATNNRLQIIDHRADGRVLCEDMDAVFPTRILCRRDDLMIYPKKRISRPAYSMFIKPLRPISPVIYPTA